MKRLLIAIFSIALVLIFAWLFTRQFDDDVVIVTAHYKENLEWLKRTNMKVIVCDKPGADPMPFPPDPKCSLGENRGREASVYLKYIIENYDNLPKYIAFIHGHEEAWHQSDDMLELIRRAKKEARPYISLNNRIDLRCDEEPKDINIELPHSVEDRNAAFILIIKNWDNIFGPILKIPKPRYLRFKCCAQFIVSRDAILRHTKDEYKTLYDFVMDPNEDDFFTSCAIEFIWHMLFGENYDICTEDPLSSNCSADNYKKLNFTD